MRDINRRDFLKSGVVLGGALVGAPTFLAACAGGPSSGSSPASGTPKRGGALRVGISGGSAADQVDAHVILSSADNARLYNLYEWLSIRDPHYQLKRVLATGYEYPAPDECVVTLRPDVVFHNGKKFGADDVIYSFKRILDPATKAGGRAVVAAFLNPDGMTKVDDLTVRFKFTRPFAVFEDFVARQLIAMVPVGYDPNKPVGTGPFKFQSFTPGERSLFVRHDDYWGDGPYVDSLEIINFNDDAARVNALVSGAVEAIDTVPASLLKSVQGNKNLEAIVSETASWRPITMRVDQPPFNDVRVRKAMKLIIDREQMVSQVYSGQARLGNDLYAIDDPDYASDLPQYKPDIDQAKSLLKQAGQDGMSVELVTGPVQPGAVESCVVLAEQAKAAGVNIKVTKLDPTTFYNAEYLNRTFSVDWWNSNSYLGQVALGDGPEPSYNESHWTNPDYNAMFFRAVGEQDEAKRKEICHDMQNLTHEEGGLLVFGFPNGIDAISRKITGLAPDKTGQALNSFGFKHVWFV